MSNTGILRRKSMQISVLLSVLLAVVLLVGVSPAALASGPLFHTRPDYMPLAEGPEDLTVTVEDLADANSYEALLRKYGGFAVETTLTPESDGEGRSSFFYGTDSYNFFGYAPVPGHQNVLAELVTKTDVYSLNQNADGTTEYSINWSAAPDADVLRNDLKAAAMALDEDALLSYDVDSVVDNGDGTLTVALSAFEPAYNFSGVGADTVVVEPGADTVTTYDSVDPMDEAYGTDDFVLDDGWHDGDDTCFDAAPAWDGSNGWHDGDDFHSEAPAYGDEFSYGWTDEPNAWNAYGGRYRSTYPYGPYGPRGAYYDDPWFYDDYDDGWRTPADAWNYRVDAWDTAPEAWYDEPYDDYGDYYDYDDYYGYDAFIEDRPLDDWYTDDDLWLDDWGTDEQSVMTFVVDAKTLEIRSIRESTFQADGTEVLLSEQTISYAAPESQTLNELQLMAYHYENESLVDPRTVTVIYDYGTMDELLVSRTVEKGDMLLTSFLPGYEIYSDSFGTPFAGSDGQSDVTLYAFPAGTVFDTPEEIQMLPAPASEPAADTEEELDFDTANHKIFEANSLDAILSNHSSVEYRLNFDGVDRPGYPDYVYETADMAYAESPTNAIYVGGGEYYELTVNDASGSNLYYVFDFIHNYDPLLNAGYEIVPEDYDDWWNAAEETPLACYELDGELHLISESSQADSQIFIEDYLGLPYQDQRVITEAVADAATGELIRFAYRMEQNGVVTQPLTYEISYDLAEPRACRNLRAAAQRDADQVAAITLVAFPGTDREQVQTKFIPAGSNAVYVADGPMALYEDEECTVHAGQWDKMTDQTYYMIPVEPAA